MYINNDCEATKINEPYPKIVSEIDVTLIGSQETYIFIGASPKFAS